MQSLVAVRFGMVHPVAQTVGMALVNLADCHVNLEAVVDLLFRRLRPVDDPYGKNIIDLLEGDVLVLHLVPDGIRALHARLDFIPESHLVKFGTDRSRELCEKRVTLRLRGSQFLLDGGVCVRMLIAETEVFQFGLDLVQSQPVGKRRIDIERLTRYLVLLVGRLGSKCTHIVQPVAYLDEDDTDVVAHRQQQLLEVLGLCGSLLAEDAAGNLCQSVDNLRYLRSENVLYVLDSIVGIFHHVVQQGRTDARCPESHLLTGNLGDGNGVHDIRFPRQPAHSFVCLPGKIECLGDDIHLLPVARGKIGVYQMLEGIVYHLLIVSFLNFCIVLVHCAFSLYI